jgi:phospho-N-acetylmuramoyl-pentapeptide-transferase
MHPTLLTIFAPAIVAFTIGVCITPLVTHFLYKHKIWKKQGGKTALGGKVAEVFNQLKGGEETKTPRMGGVVIWASVLLTVILMYLLANIYPKSFFTQFDFLSRSQTIIPFAALLMGAFIGFLNDFYDVTHGAKGLSLRVRMSLITILATTAGWWFYDKLDVVTVNIPFYEPLYLGIFIIPFFVILTWALYASGVIDGIDGLSGGVFASVFTAYVGIAFVQEQFQLAAFSATVVGAILAFLWYNIPPARFWMTETGSMALTLTLATIAFMTDSLGDGHGISLLLVAGLPLVLTVLSNIIQMTYRKATGKKFFRIAPLHHHFEAIGWPSYKVTMRYWIISIVCALLSVALATVV